MLEMRNLEIHAVMAGLGGIQLIAGENLRLPALLDFGFEPALRGDFLFQRRLRGIQGKLFLAYPGISLLEIQRQ